MPIDLHLLISEPTAMDAYRRQLQSRNSAQDDLLNEALQLYHRVGELRREQKKKTSSNHTVKEEGERYDYLQEKLSALLERLPNVMADLKDANIEIWGGVLVDDDSETLSSQKPQPTCFSTERPTSFLLALGAYEERQSQDPKVAPVVVWTNIGVDLEQALMTHCRQNLKAKILPKILRRHQQVEGDHLSDGLLVQQCVCSSSSDQPTSAWRDLLNRCQGLKLYDRQLPQTHMILNTTTNRTNKDMLDARDEGMMKSWRQRVGTKRPSRRRPWYERLLIQRKLQVVMLTGPLWSVDGLPMLCDLVQSTVQFLQELVGTSSSETSLFVRARKAHVKELTNAEANRIIIEGWYHDRYVTLSYWSCFLDYHTQTAGIRHGTTKQCLGVIEGTFAQTTVLLEWLVEARRTTGSSLFPEWSVPQCLRNVDTSLPRTVPVVNRVTVSKKTGKTLVERIVQGKLPAVLIGEPSVDRVCAERNSCPFDFLPFYDTIKDNAAKLDDNANYFGVLSVCNLYQVDCVP